MADAGVLRAGDRLPWLEPYRAPPRKSSNRKAGVAAIIGGAGLAGIATLLATRIMPLPQSPAVQTAEIALPPAMIKLDAVPGPLVAPAETPSIGNTKVVHRKPTVHRGHQTVRRRIKAEPTRIAYGEIVQEQAGETAATDISEEALAIALMPAPPVDPPRPAVDPSARVVRGKTVQLGVFKTARQAEIAWRSAVRDYTYLVTMPKSIQPIRIRSKLYYRLQLGTPSKSHARQLCGNLKQIGRSCTVA